MSYSTNYCALKPGSRASYPNRGIEMEDQIKTRIAELIAQRDQILGQIQQINTKRQELEVAYQQTAGAIAGLYEFAPQEEVEAPEVAENGQAPELELAEA